MAATRRHGGTGADSSCFQRLPLDVRFVGFGSVLRRPRKPIWVDRELPWDGGAQGKAGKRESKSACGGDGLFRRASIGADSRPIDPRVRLCRPLLDGGGSRPNIWAIELSVPGGFRAAENSAPRLIFGPRGRDPGSGVITFSVCSKQGWNVPPSRRRRQGTLVDGVVEINFSHRPQSALGKEKGCPRRALGAYEQTMRPI